MIHRRDEEHRLQVSCIRWFRLQYPKLCSLLFAVPNGSPRDKVTAAKLKAEGVVAGVSDLILLHTTPQHAALLIEMKTPKGKQSTSQKQWQQAVTKDRYKYVVCHSIEEFVQAIKEYLAEK